MKINGKYKNILLLLALSVLIIALVRTAIASNKYVIPADPELLEISQDTLKSQMGIKEETGNNDGEQILKFLRTVNINFPANWCAAIQYWGMKSAKEKIESSGCKTVEIPIPRSAVANAHYNYAKEHGYKDEYKAEVHDLIVWRVHNSSWRGHIERIDSVGRAGWVKTLAGNSRNEANYRKRNIKHPVLGRLKIRGLVGFYKGER